MSNLSTEKRLRELRIHTCMWVLLIKYLDELSKQWRTTIVVCRGFFASNFSPSPLAKFPTTTGTVKTGRLDSEETALSGENL